MLPGGARNERQMQQMMRRLGMKTEEIPGVEEVIVRTRQNEHIFRSPEVTILTVQGTRTYQVVGTPEIRPRTAAPATSTASVPSVAAPAGPSEEDVALVMEQAQVDREEAVEALRAVDGAPAEAILRILSRKGSESG